MKKAAAVKHNLDNDKLQVVAGGSGSYAKEIIEVAKKHNIEIVEDPNLAEVLSTLDIYEDIPEDLYGAVAEILAELYKINKQL